MKKSFITLAIAATSLVALNANAATFAAPDYLTITSGKRQLDANGNTIGFTGSYFGMDANGDSNISSQSEKTSLKMGTTGIMAGVATSPGAHHTGIPTAGDTNDIDKPWSFFGSTGSDYTTVGITGDTTNGLDLSGWTVAWNNISTIPMGTGAWQPGNCAGLSCTGQTFSNGIANFTWDGVIGNAYSLNYSATVPVGDPSGFGGVSYYLHLEGTVQAVPEASTYCMMLAGLGLIGIASRRRKNA
jgi:hypothetical protein